MYKELELAKGYIRKQKVFDNNRKYESMLSAIQVVMLNVSCEIKKELV